MAHHYQETDVSCGAAALRMALERLGLPAPPEARLVDELETDQEGTRWWRLEEVARRRGLEARTWYGDVTLRDVEALLETHVVMVCYQAPTLGVGHFALVSDVAQDHVELDDPWFGPCRCIDRATFDAVWRSEPPGAPPRVHWVLAMRRGASPSG